MALQLLGSKYCIESLRSDVTDLQEAIVDVMSRAGPVRQPSWKYPDKTGCDLDMTELLDLYDYSGDEEERQIAHIVLLELVIDRMVLLLQTFTKYLDQMTLSGRAAASPQVPGAHNTSIGLVVKKYWNKIVNLQSVVHTLNTDNKNNKRKAVELDNNMKKVLQEKELLLTTVTNLKESLQSSNAPFPLSETELLEKTLSRASSVVSISKDECNKATQTFETAFVPCESCDCVQKSYRRCGDLLISMCQAQGLPSCLAKFKPQVKGLDWMTANDVIRWSAEQGKDVERLAKHLQDFDALKDELRETKTLNHKLNQKIGDLNKEVRLEKETQNTQRRHFEGKIKDVKQRGEDDVNDVKRKNEELNKGKQQLQTQLGQMKGELEKQQVLMADLEAARSNLQSELHENQTNNSAVKALEVDIQRMTERLTEVTSNLENARTDFNKEKVKNTTMTKHMESIQGRQESLATRLGELDQENDQLKTEVSELEDIKDELEKSLYSANEEKERLQDQVQEGEKLVKEITREKNSLEKSMVELKQDITQLETTLQEAKEQEKLLIEYPDLNGPVNPDFSGTGDIAKDMENQLKANSLRIQVLEEQNAKLRNSITKILQTQQQQNSRFQAGAPVPLWKAAPDSPEQIGEPVDERGSRRKNPVRDRKDERGMRGLEKTAEDTRVRESFVIGRGRKSPDKKMMGKAAGTRPPSGKGSSTGGSSYPASKKIGGSNRDLDVGRPPSSQSGYQRADVLMCPRCDKMYNSKRDLDIHQSYCQG